MAASGPAAAPVPSAALGLSEEEVITIESPINSIMPAIFPVKPFWMADDYFSRMMPVIMAQYIIFVLLSQLIHRAHRHLHQTRFVSKIMAAVIMGPSFIGRNKYIYSKLYPAHNDMMMPTNVMGILGINLYVFLATVKIDTKYMIMRAGKKAFQIAIPSIFLAAVMMVVCIRYLRTYIDNDLPSVYPTSVFCFYIAFSASPNLVTALNELNLMSSETDQFTIFTAVVIDFTKWLIILAFEVVRASEGYLGPSIALIISVTTLMVTFCVWIVRPRATRFVKSTQPISSSYVVSLTLGAMLMHMLGGMVFGNPLLGPLLFGLCIPSGPPLGSALVKNIELVAEEILLPFFYIQVGSKLDLIGVMNSATFYLVAGVVFVGHIIKFVAVSLSARLCGFNNRDSVSIGLMLDFSGLVSVYTFDRLINIELYNPTVYISLIMSSMLVNAIVTPLVKTVHHHKDSTGQNEVAAAAQHEINSIQGSRMDAEFRVIACVYDESNVSSITNLLEISNLSIKTVSCSVCAYVIHMSELSGQTAPLFGPHFNHTRICHHNGCDKILSAFNNYTRFSKEHVLVMPFTSISPYKTMHEEICRLANDKDIPLIILPFYINKNSDSVNLTINQVVGQRSVYTKMQRQALSTIGILIDKSHSRSFPHMMKRTAGHKSSSSNKYNVAIIFIGGVDDREALAYGIRMLGRPGLRVTLLRILMTAEWEIAYNDEDMALVEEFKIKSEMTNNKASYHDIIVENLGKAMEATRRFVRKYDLVIVGQRQETSSVWLQEGMKEWMEYPELGLVGDMLASSDAKSRVTSVLVLHHNTTHVAETAKTDERSRKSISKWNTMFTSSPRYSSAESKVLSDFV